MKAISLLILSLLTSILFSFSPESKKYIVIDARHGGEDTGVSFEGVNEKDIVLNIAQQIKKASDIKGKYEIILTRDRDINSTLSERTGKINRLNPEMVISLHVNRTAQPQSERAGHEIFIQKNQSSRVLAEKLQKKLGDCPIKEENLYILRESKSPALVLELGFINNNKDKAYMNSEKGQREIAEKIADFINEN